MPRKGKWGYRSSNLGHKPENLKFEELDRAEFMGLTLIGYKVSDGDPEDVATTIETRIAIFNTEDLPDDPYHINTDRYRYSFEGLVGAVSDECTELNKERDEDALMHRKLSESLMNPDDYQRDRNVRLGIVSFEDFLAAVARIKEDDTDEEAWATIESWRTRQLRQEERAV